MNLSKNIIDSDEDYALSSHILYYALACNSEVMTVDLATTIGLSLSRSTNLIKIKNKEIKNGN